MSDAGPDAWKAPGSGAPLEPDAAARPSADEIASRVAQRLVVPRGPVRTATLMLGLLGSVPTRPGAVVATLPAATFNSRIDTPVLGSSGIIRAVDFLAQMVTTGAAAGILQLFDGDTNAPLLRTFPINVGAAGTYSVPYTIETAVPFLNGILAVWSPIVGAFGAGLLVCNIDFESIPIGQKLDQSP